MHAAELVIVEDAVLILVLSLEQVFAVGGDDEAVEGHFFPSRLRECVHMFQLLFKSGRDGSLVRKLVQRPHQLVWPWVAFHPRADCLVRADAFSEDPELLSRDDLRPRAVR